MRFRVNGTPAPQGSKRHVGNGRMVEVSRAVAPWREAVRAESQRALNGSGPLAGPVAVTAVFVLARPKGHYTRPGLFTKAGAAQPFPAKRPDLDKLARAVLDGLVAGGTMADDAQVVSLNAAKVYARPDEAPGVLIEVEAMS